jgi:ELWxxDGT repeat protein
MKRSHTSPHRFNALRLCSAQARRPRPPIVPARLEQLEERTLLSAALIKDINATPSNPRNLAAVGSTLYYTSTNASGGTNLYKTDGDAGDQVLLKSFPATSVVAISLDARAALGSKLFFVADDGTTGGELWVTDGTAGGTKLVKDIFSGSNSSMAPLAEGTFAVVAGSFYFVANDGSTANEIWKSDGSEAGTVILKDIRPGASLSSVPLGLTAFGSKLIFTAIDGVNGREVYASNGTAPGTVMLSNINPTGGSAPAEFTVVGTTLFFAATDGSGDRELWKTDGTPANTVRVKDIRPGSTSSNPNWLTALGNTLYFAANDGTGRELWKSDGTAGGTVKVQDLSGEPNGSQPTSVVALGSHIIFMTATDSGGSDLFRTDGTTTEKLADLTAFPVPAPDSTTAPRKLVVAGSKLFITFIDPATGRFALWASNGTAAGTLKLRNLQPGASFASNILNAGLMVGLGGQLFFADKDQAHGVELWKSDGTQAGTLFVKDINPGTGNSLPRELTAMGGNVYFSAKAASGADQLWKSNGTSAGSSALESFTTGAAIGSSISHPVQVGNIIIFFADDGVTGKELWKTDGSTTGTTLLKDFSPLGGVTPFWTTALNGQFYFLVGGNSSVSGLWRTDGSAAGTVLFKNINLVTARPNVLVFNGSLYFALETATNVQLWRHNATTGETGTILADLPKSDDSITNLTVANNIIFFLTQDSRNTLSIERRLWTSDGTPAGTAELVTFNAEPTASTEIIGFGNFAYFRANDGNTGSELWRSDGTAFGTTVVQELAPGTGSSTPLPCASWEAPSTSPPSRTTWAASSGAYPALAPPRSSFSTSTPAPQARFWPVRGLPSSARRSISWPTTAKSDSSSGRPTAATPCSSRTSSRAPVTASR